MIIKEKSIINFVYDTCIISTKQVKKKIITEGWRYLQLSGKYKNKNHSLAFKEFCLKIEELKMKQVQKELEDVGNDNNEDDNFIGSTNSITPDSCSITEPIINLNNLNNERKNNIETNL